MRPQHTRCFGELGPEGLHPWASRSIASMQSRHARIPASKKMPGLLAQPPANGSLALEIFSVQIRGI